MDALARGAHGVAFVALFVATAVVVGAFGYLVVSFAAMRRHTPARRAWATLRAMLAEALAIAITQPLIPVFYVLGHRMSGARPGVPIVFVHGYFQNRADFVYLAWRVHVARLGPAFGFNYDWTRDVDSCSRRLAAFVERVCEETGAPKVRLVAHSLGGIVALEYLATPEGAARVDRCVTIASPHAGVAWRVGMIGASARQLSARSDYMRTRASRALSIPVTSLFSTHDNIVHPASTSALGLRGGEDESIEGIGHLSMLFSREVADAMVRRLAG